MRPLGGFGSLSASRIAEEKLSFSLSAPAKAIPFQHIPISPHTFFQPFRPKHTTMLPHTLTFLATLLLTTTYASIPANPSPDSSCSPHNPYPHTVIPLAPHHPIARGGGGGGGGRPAPRPAPRPKPRPDGVDEAQSNTAGSGSGYTSTFVSTSKISLSSTQTVETLTTSTTTGSALSTTREVAVPVETGAAGRVGNGGWGVVAGLIGLFL